MGLFRLTWSCHGPQIARTDGIQCESGLGDCERMGGIPLMLTWPPMDSSSNSSS